MAQNVNNEAMKLLPNQQNDQPQIPPKLSMKLLHELIQELKQDNIQLKQRLEEYEADLATLLQSKQEVAAGSVSMPIPIEEAKHSLTVTEGAIAFPCLIHSPRAERHRSGTKYSILLILLHSLKKILFPRHKRHIMR